MNRNEAIEFLKRNEWGTAVEGWDLDDTALCYRNGLDVVIIRSDVFVTESLQSRIETLLDMKFETEEKLLETIGSLWGGDLRREVYKLAEPYRNESDKGPLDTLKRLVLERNDLEPTIRKILDTPDSHDWYQICDEVRLVHKQASDLHKVATLLLECGVMNNDDTVLTALKRLVEPKVSERIATTEFESGLINCLKKISLLVGRKFAVDVGYGNLPDVVAEALAGPQKTYWDGEEPLRVGHIVQGGEVVAIHKDVTCIKYAEGLANYRATNIKPHPFAKYTDEQREFLQAQVEAGVIKLC